MKHLLFWLSTSLLLTNCAKDQENNPAPAGGTDQPSTLSAKVTGYPAVAYTSPTGALNTPVSAARISTTDPNYGPAMLYIKAGTTSQGLALTLAKFAGTGTYVLKSDYSGTLTTNNTAVYADGTSSYRSAYMPGSGVAQGQVVVTSYDEATHRVKGTFSFSGSDVNPQNLPASHIRQVTDGAFDINVTL